MSDLHGISVAICTWNRADLLDVTLDSLCGLAVPEGLAWEVLVVDNGSTDATAEVTRRFSDRLPVRHVWAPEPGLGNVRNAAVAAARFTALAFIDDDVRVTRRWLAALWEALEAHPEAAFVGGTITPEFMAPPPAWLVRAFPHVQNYYSVQDRGPNSAGPITGGTFPYGANVCFRTALARAVGFDRSVIYRSTASLAAGDESMVIAALLAEGRTGWWAPEAALAHRIQPARMTLGWLLTRLRGAGEELARVWPPASRQFLNSPLWAWRDFASTAGRAGLRALLIDPLRWAGDASRTVVVGQALLVRHRGTA